MNLIDVTQQFKSDDDCLAYLESMRWPDGIRCPVCGCDRISKITRTNVRKDEDSKKRTNKRTRIYPFETLTPRGVDAEFCRDFACSERITA